jgi:exopolyphosphatase/guanosine-5'-triphosphate,3'-diphosphate pyrophosphatase
LADPAHLAAIDAGSNAIRLMIARATSPTHIQELETERAAVRLGHNAFTRGQLDNGTIRRAAKAFTHFRAEMDRYCVSTYRAVATSAAREARNRRALIERIRLKSGIELEVITGAEEARLVRNAVLAALGGSVSPQLILDLGGGSLELNFMRERELERSIALPLGSVRLMETFRITGAISEDLANKVRHHVVSRLRSLLPARPQLTGALAVACGGNAEALARLVPGPRFRGMSTLNLRLLRERLWHILRLDVPARMESLGVRKERAEVIGIAAIVFNALGDWLKLREMVVPGVGVREGVLLDLVAAHYAQPSQTIEDKKSVRTLLAGAQWFSRRLGVSAPHAEQVRRLALSLFDQLQALHHLGPDLRVVLEEAALLHDVGHFINRKSHHRHGEYLVRYGQIPGLRAWRREMVACLVRYHNGKDTPRLTHRLYASLDRTQRQQVRLLSALLRIAENLESDHRQAVLHVEVELARRAAVFRVWVQNGAHCDLVGVSRKAALFEREFHRTAVFKRVSLKEKKKKVA